MFRTSLSKFAKRTAERSATFDDLASDECKQLRRDIFAEADRVLGIAAKEATKGNAKGAAERLETSRQLRWLAINIPLEILEREQAAAGF